MNQDLKHVDFNMLATRELLKKKVIFRSLTGEYDRCFGGEDQPGPCEKVRSVLNTSITALYEAI